MRNKCVAFTVMVINLCDSILNSAAKFVYEKQIIRSASSIGANHVEGSGGVSRKIGLII